MADVGEDRTSGGDRDDTNQDQNNVTKSDSECQQSDTSVVCNDEDTDKPGNHVNSSHGSEDENNGSGSTEETASSCASTDMEDPDSIEQNGQSREDTSNISQTDIQVTGDDTSEHNNGVETNVSVPVITVTQDDSSLGQSESDIVSESSEDTQNYKASCVDHGDAVINSDDASEENNMNTGTAESELKVEETVSSCDAPMAVEKEALQQSSVCDTSVADEGNELSIDSSCAATDDSNLSQDDDKLLSELSAELGVHTSELPNGLKKEIVASEMPEYKDLLTKYKSLEEQCNEHTKELQSLQQSHQQKLKELQLAHKASNTMRLEVQRIQAKESSTVETYQVTVKQLETAVESQKRELAQFKEKQLSHDTAAKRAINKLQKEMATRVDQVKKMYEDAVKEKESMVIKFARSEKEQMDLQKINHVLEKKLAEHNKQSEATLSQFKAVKADRNKMKSQFDSKDTEIANLQKEVEKLKEDINSQGIKVKWAQNKLKTELDAHKETRLKLQKTETKLAEAREETEQIRKNCQEMIKTYQESEEIKSNSLDIKLKERETELEFEKRQKSDNIEMYDQVCRELEALKKTMKDKVAESVSLKEKIKEMEGEKVKSGKIIAEFKELLNNQKDSNRKLTIQVDDMQNLQEELAKEKTSVKRLEEELATLQANNSDLENGIASLNRKQSELLQFTEKITAKNAELLSTNAALSSKVATLSEEINEFTEMCNQLKKNNSSLTGELDEEKVMRHKENELLTSKLEEKSKAVESLTVQLDDVSGDMKTLKRKHAANIKDLSRQLQHATKKLESNETGESNAKETMSTGSRTSSNGSLDTAAGTLAATTAQTTTVTTTAAAASTPNVVTRTPSQDKQGTESKGGDYPTINKAMLIERIVKLQKINHRKTEKIEFLEDHVNQMLDEMQKKSKIIQQFVLREQTGALAPASMDANKAKIARQGGIMASVYNSHANDPSMTLDLSLQINKKLQAVLEDTLLKNITLKENIDTLGDEIASLTQQLSQNEGMGSARKS